MKKYKHKKTGYIAQQCAGVNYQLLKDIEYSTNIPKELIEESNEWEEINEKDYEILSFKRDSSSKYEGTKFTKNDKGLYSTDFMQNNLTLEHCLLGGFDIYSVKRLSDNEIFTIGDKVEYSLINYGWDIRSRSNILKFEIQKDQILINTDIFLNWAFLSDTIRKVKKKPLFKTADGVDIFEGDKYYHITEDLNIIDSLMIASKDEDCPWIYKVNEDKFSTKEAAEEYILMNKPCLSVKDFEKLWLNSCYSDEILEKVKEIARSK